MPREQLPPDPDALEEWQKMPQNQPSKHALPPVSGGLQWLWWLLPLIGALILIALLQGQ